MLNFKKIMGLDYFTSEIDIFLHHFDASHPKLSASQLAERKKYDRIGDLRDHAQPAQKQVTLWDKF